MRMTFVFVWGCLGSAVIAPTLCDAQVRAKHADLVAESAVSHSAMSATEMESVAEAYQRHEYTLQSDGNLAGKIMMFDSSGIASPARVKLYFLRDQEVVSQAMPDEYGMFQAANLQPGHYALVAAGQGGFAAAGIRVLPPPERPEAPKANTIGRARTVSQPTPATIPMTTFAIPGIDVQPAFYLAQQYVPGMSGMSLQPNTMAPVNSGPSGYPRLSQRAAPPAISPSRLVAESNADANDRAITAEAALKAYESHEFPLDADGKLSGLLRSFDSTDRLVPADVLLFFIRDGRVMAQTTVDAAGGFEIDGLNDGYYSLVAAGRSGFAAIGIRVLPAPQRPQAPKANSIGRVRNVSLQPGGLRIPLNVSPINPRATQASFQIAQQQGTGGLQTPPFTPFGPNAPFAGGPAGGGGGGGFGAGGGFGGAGALGALLGAGGLAAGLSNNGGTSSSTTTTASPN